MRDSWSRRWFGRSLLRDRPRRRARPIGSCPICRETFTGSTECWLDAERALDAHLPACPGERMPVVETPPDRRVLRLA